MEQPSQGLHSILTPPNLTAEGGNTEPEHAAATENVVGAQPTIIKKRKPNASGPRRTSLAWDHFNVIPGLKEQTAACKHCHKKYLCDTKQHGTSNMLAHLKVCPKYPHAIVNDTNQTTLTFTGAAGTGLVAASTRFNLEACKKALAVFVIMDEQPFRVVEGEGFKYLVRQLQPQFSVPSRRTVARHCFQLYLDEKLKLKALFKSDSTRVALTTDCWTSIQNLNYLTLTAHFIDNEWNYQKKIISFCVVPNHRGETVGMKVEEVLRDWGIRRVSTITVDNASSNDVAVAYLKRKFKNMNGLMVDGGFFHMRCCAHVLNLVVNDGLKDMHTSISTIRSVVRFVRSSPSRAAKFKECIEFSKISCKKQVCLDVSTRWNSTYLMLEAAEKYQAAFEMLVHEVPDYVDYFGTAGPPSADDWENVRVFVKFLKLFFEATLVFSASQEVSLHTAFQQLSTIYCELNQSALNLNTILATMGLEMKKKYEKYWGKIENINQFVYFGTIFDPRYKLRYVEWSFEQMYGQSSTFASDLSTSVKNNLFTMYNWYKQKYDHLNTSGQPLAGPSGGVSNNETPAVAEISSSQARDEAFKLHLLEKDSIDKLNELERFLTEPNISGDAKFDILVWWKQNSSRYPILSTIVRDLMATPVSTVASESAFSAGGRVIDTYRSSLNPEMAEALICVQNWLRPSFTQFKDLNLDEEYGEVEDVVIEFQGDSAAFGGTGGAVSAAGVGPSSQSQPTGCD